MKALNVILLAGILVLSALSYMAVRETRVMVGINRCMIEVSEFMGEEAYSVCVKGTAFEE